MITPRHGLTKQQWMDKLVEEWQQVGQGTLDLECFWMTYGEVGTDELHPKDAIFEDFASA